MIKNYSTTIDEGKTVGEIMGLLAGKGARSIQIGYDQQGRPDNVSFILEVDKVPVPFKLPCNFEGVWRAIASSYKDRMARNRYERNPANRQQARRIAWRIIKDWVAAQLALIEAEQATMAQVFLPYVVSNNGMTMYDNFMLQVSSTKALPAGPGQE